MKIAVKKFLLGALTAVLSVCVGLTVITSVSDIAPAKADDPTVVNLTMENTQYQNNTLNGGKYYTSLCFLHTDEPSVFGVSSGSSTGADFSDILSKTTYTGSANTVSYINAYAYGWGANTSSKTFRFIYIVTANAPTAGDKIEIEAGAWFITGGTINEKYVLSSKITMIFGGTQWAYAAFTLDGTDDWGGADQSGDNGAQLTAWGIENTGTAAAYPTSGTYAFLTTNGVLAYAATANQASGITGIKYNGTPIKDVSGAVVAEWKTRLNIYVPYTTGIISIEKETIVGNSYAAADYYFKITPVSNKTYGRMSLINVSNTTSFALSETGTGITWNGSNQGNTSIFGIEYNAVAPASGSFNLINGADNTLLTHDIDNDLIYTPAGKTILCNGTPLAEISGAHICIAYSMICIYVPVDNSIITIQAGTRLGQGYYVDKEYKYKFNKGNNNSTLCYLVEFDSDGGSSVSSVYVNNGAIVSEPTAPTKAATSEKEYVFDGWVDENEDEFNFDTAITSNITLTAAWKEINIVNVTFTGMNTTWNNYEYDSSGFTRYNFLEFTGGISSGSHVSGSMDYSNLLLNTTYSGSSLTYGYHSFSLIVGENVANSNMIIFRTSVDPSEGDCLIINAGAWFTVGGTDTNKYVLSSEIGLTFNGSAWVILPKYNLFDSRDNSLIGQINETVSGSNYIYRMPTNLSYSGYKVFGFALTDNKVEYFYPAGATHTSTSNNIAVIAIIGSFFMTNGASVRITTAETSGIRWQTNVDSEAKSHILYWGKTGTTFGTEISAEGFASNFDIKTKFWKTSGSYNTVLSDINSDYYDTEFTARAYVDISYSDDTTQRIYADNGGVTRTIAYVAGAALDDPLADWSERQTEILTAIAGR